MKKKWKLAPNKIIAPVVFGLLVFAGGAWVGGFAGNRTDTDAISAMDFNHGRIIDDAIFYNKDAMSVAQIEQFLREKGPACDINGDKYDARAVNAKAGTTRRDYALHMARNGSSYYHAPPYICVNNYYENPVTKKTSFDTWGQPFEGGQSAAQIIYNAAQSYGINPQVILVTLKKEWSYTYTDEWPMRSDYNTVMGYGCPDTGPNGSANCSAKYYGFYNQVNNAAWQFKQYKDYPGNYNYRAGRWSSIGYNVAARGCGYRDVYIENAATAALYNYTPYVPNDAALRAYPGTGDYCSTYGNRNFYMFFGEWFGTALREPMEEQLWKRYEELNKENGILGHSIDYIYCYTKNGDRYCVQRFENGYIISSKYGAWENYGEVRKRWSELGYENGVLGYPVGPIVKIDTELSQEYENGRIVIDSKISSSY